MMYCGRLDNKYIYTIIHNRRRDNDDDDDGNFADTVIPYI